MLSFITTAITPEHVDVSAPRLPEGIDQIISNKIISDDDLSSFLGEWEGRLASAQSAGCHYSDLVLALKLIEKTNLGEETLATIFSTPGLYFVH